MKIKDLWNKGKKFIRNKTGIGKEDKLDLRREFSLLFFFHFNQYQTPFASLVEEVAYRRFFSLVEKFNFPVVVNISAPLLRVLLYKESPLIGKLKELKERGLVSFTASSWAENILSVTPDNIKRESVLRHRELIEKVFGSQKYWGYWSSERVWEEGQIKFLSQEGFSYSWIENRILEEAGFPLYIDPFWVKGRNFLVLPDTKELKWAVDNFINGDGDDFSELNTCFASCSPDCRILSFAEDAEVFKVWSLERHGKEIMERDEKNLKSLLESLTSEEKITLIKVEDLIERYSLKEIETEDKFWGWAHWLDVSCKSRDQFFWEEGFSDWKDFITRSPKIKKYQQVFSEYLQSLEARREKLETISDEKKEILSNALNDLKLIVLSHLWEFGCVGIGGDDYTLWTGIKVFDELLKIVDLELNLSDSENGIIDEDERIYLHNKKLIAVLNPVTGSILHIFDRSKGVFFRDYLTHFYEEKNEDLKKENLILVAGKDLWKWFEVKPILKDYPHLAIFKLKRFNWKVFFDFRDSWNEIEIFDIKIGRKELYLRSYLPLSLGFIDIVYKLLDYDIEIEVIPSTCLDVKCELSALPQAFNIEKGFSVVDGKICNLKTGDFISVWPRESEVVSVLEKDFFSYTIIYKWKKEPLKFNLSLI